MLLAGRANQSADDGARKQPSVAESQMNGKFAASGLVGDNWLGARNFCDAAAC